MAIMSEVASPVQSVYLVWLRYFMVFRKNIWYGIMTTFIEPVLYLTSFGFGVGSMIGNVGAGGESVSYRAFVLAGIAGQTVLFTAFFEGAYGGFVRMYYQKVFQAIAVTPVTLSEVLWGELLWSATRALFSTTIVLLIGIVIGDFSVLGSAAALPICLVACLMFSALGMLMAAMARTIESLSYPQYLFIFPMFLFCGVYFPLENLPDAIEFFAHLLPLTSLLSIIRTLLLGFDFQWWAPLVFLGWTLALIPWARRRMRTRLVA